ncbi:MAG: class II aldolase/adducin family protein [Campylobacterota bacterium]|nr:class II aldolase/adducin family protein [Campylobacterota bacterium]
MIDGVIKYNCEFTPTKPLESAQYEEIETVRERLYALGLIGICDGIGYGNISQRLDAERFVVTGTQTGHLSQLGGSDYALIEAYEDAAFYLKASGMIKPSSESLTHGTIYDLSPKIGAVIHIHSASMWRYMLDKGYRKTEDVLYGSQEMIDEVKRIYAQLDPLSDPKFVMSGHEEGVMFFGETLKSAELTLLDLIGIMLSDEIFYSDKK